MPPRIGLSKTGDLVAPELSSSSRSRLGWDVLPPFSILRSSFPGGLPLEMGLDPAEGSNGLRLTFMLNHLGGESGSLLPPWLVPVRVPELPPGLQPHHPPAGDVQGEVRFCPFHAQVTCSTQTQGEAGGGGRCPEEGLGAVARGRGSKARQGKPDLMAPVFPSCGDCPKPPQNG